MLTKDKSFEAVSFLAWVDGIERLDTLLLELRHLQINIIHALREGDLYKPLKEEEGYIWGDVMSPVKKDWLAIFSHPEFSTNHIRYLAHRWIVRYPALGKKNGKYDPLDKKFPPYLENYLPTDEQRETLRSVQEKVNSLRVNGVWSNDARRHYYNLSSAQIIKRNVLRDKMVLCWWGSKAFGLLDGGPKADKDAIAHFFIVRSAIVARARRYVYRLGDLQAQLEKSMDMSLQDNPRPMLGRRREQGIYTAFLSESTRDTGHQIVNFLEELGAPNRGERFGFAETPDPIIMHRWSHSYTSRSIVFEDDIKLRNSDDPDGPQNIHFINSSFWLPEQPSLQPIIAHEVAHNAIYERYGYFDTRTMKNPEDRFSSLIRRLHYCMESSGLSRSDPNIDPRHLPDYATREIAADILAASSKGTAYLMAMFYECVAQGVEVIFHAPIDRFDLDAADYVKSTTPQHDLEREWYLRIRVVCSWLRATQPSNSHCAFSNIAITGIKEVVETIMEKLSRNVSSPSNVHHKYWERLADRMCKIVSNSDAAKKSKKINTYLFERENKKNQCLAMYPRYLEPLEEPIREFLYDAWIEEKKSDGRFLHYLINEDKSPFQDFRKAYLEEKYSRIISVLENNNDDKFEEERAFVKLASWDEEIKKKLMRRGGLEAFLQLIDDMTAKQKQLLFNDFVQDFINEVYFGKGRDFNGNKIRKQKIDFIKSNNIFTHSHDIPWQCSISRAIDFINPKYESIPNPESKSNDWLSRMHKSMSLGRELYAVGLEFYLWHYRSAFDRLTIAIRALASIEDDEAMDAETLVKWSKWKGDINGERGSKERLVNLIGSLRKYMKKPFDEDARAKIATELKGISALDLILENPLSHASEGTKKEQFIDKRILEKLQGHKLKELAKIFDGIENGDRISRLRGLKAYLNIRSDKSLFYGDVFDAIGPSLESQCRKIQTFMLGRVSLSGARARLPNPEKDKEASKSHGEIYERTLTNPWFDGPEGNRRCYEPILGRQDILLVEPVKPLSRCLIPQFKKSSEYLPFFIRRELALGIHLPLQGKKDLFQSGDFAGALSIVVNERATRLDFLARILRSIKENGDCSISDTEKITVEDICDEFNENDCAFLSEGWGDIILIFKMPGITPQDSEKKKAQKNLDRLNSIFDIQNIVYEDFLVERTELILSPKFISIVASVDKGNNFSVTTQVRLTEDRGLGRHNKEFIQSLDGYQKYFELFQIPGRTDFMLQFHNSKLSDPGSEIFQSEHPPVKILHKAVCQGYVDVTMTTIGKCRQSKD